MSTHPNDQDRSWRRKVARAEEHLVDLANRIAPLQERRAYPVSEGFEDYEGSRQYVRRVSLPHLDDPMLEILVGELMFNARSALDHLACALVPPGQRTRKVMRATQFSIVTVDVDDPANANARDGWPRHDVRTAALEPREAEGEANDRALDASSGARPSWIQH